MSADLREQFAGVVGVFQALRHGLCEPADVPVQGSPGDRLRAAASAWPAVYRVQVIDPLLGWSERWAAAPRAVQDVARGVLDRAASDESLPATLALQELVSDIYAGFLDAEDRVGFRPPDRRVLAPIVTWGEPGGGPYIYPADALEPYGIAVSVISMPPGFRRFGLPGWTLLGHEVAGHDILLANAGLGEELARSCRGALAQAGLEWTAEHWIARLDEVAADVLGILNVGPAMGAGLLVFLRGFRAARHGVARLLGEQPGETRYPADLLRMVVVSTVISRLRCAAAASWLPLLDAEVSADLRMIDDPTVMARWPAMAHSAAIVATVIAGGRLGSLGGRAFEELQNWSDEDEAIAAALAESLRTGVPATPMQGARFYAAHAVAGATYVALSTPDLDAERWHRGVVTMLAAMHRDDPLWSAG